MAQFLLPPQWSQQNSWDENTGNALDTTYQAGNSPRFVALTWSGNSGVEDDRVNVLVGLTDPPTAIVAASIMEQGSADTEVVTFMVPAKHYYRVEAAAGSPAAGVWSELDA